MAQHSELQAELKAVSKRLHQLIGTTLDAEAKEPPRLVRANSAFDLLKTIDKLIQNPDFPKLGT